MLTSPLKGMEKSFSLSLPELSMKWESKKNKRKIYYICEAVGIKENYEVFNLIGGKKLSTLKYLTS